MDTEEDLEEKTRDVTRRQNCQSSAVTNRGAGGALEGHSASSNRSKLNNSSNFNIHSNQSHSPNAFNDRNFTTKSPNQEEYIEKLNKKNDKRIHDSNSGKIINKRIQISLVQRHQNLNDNMNFARTNDQEGDGLGYVDGLESKPDIVLNIKSSYVKEKSQYLRFFDNLLFGNYRRNTVMEPVPPSIGMVKMQVVRNRQGINKLSPSYSLNIQKITGGGILILYAKKILMKKSAYYLISLGKNDSRVGSIANQQNACIGKMRALETDHTKFILYDAGESFTKKGTCREDVRAEHGAFLYRFVPAQMGKMRKMDIIIPTVKRSSYGISKLALMAGNMDSDEENDNGEKPGDDSDSQSRQAQKQLDKVFKSQTKKKPKKNKDKTSDKAS